MTVIQHVTGKEMLRRTGANALGYTYPDKDLILLQKGLTGKKKQNVLAHEQEHLRKGEEGPLFGLDDAIIGGGISAIGSLLGGNKQSKQDKKALDFQRQQATQTREDLAPYRGYGLSDYDAWKASPEGEFRFVPPGYSRQNVMSKGPQGLSYDDWAAGQGRSNNPKPFINDIVNVLNNQSQGTNRTYHAGTGSGDTSRAAYDRYLSGLGGDYVSGTELVEGDWRTDPAYQFNLSEGNRAIENSAAAAGGLLSGNAIRGISDYTQNVASNEYGKIYNREYQRQMDEYLTDYQRKFGDVGLGYNASAGGAALGIASANQIGNSYNQLGRSEADTYNNVFGSIAGGIGDYFGNQQANDMIQQYWT